MVELAVVPFEAGLRMSTLHGFWVFAEWLVLVETLRSELSLRDAEDVALYNRHFERLWEVAAPGRGGPRRYRQGGAWARSKLATGRWLRDWSRLEPLAVNRLFAH
jgi:Domain of unknown function (DUF5753)